MVANLVVTIDGPAGAGKSTVARQLADALGFEFLDTGAGYRAVSLLLLRRGLNEEVAAQELIPLLSDFQFEIIGKRFRLHGEDVTGLLRDPAVTNLAGRIAGRAEVRGRLTRWQQDYAEGRHLVTEGRDQGTVVFPHAVCKFFLTASEEVRLERRLLDLRARGITLPREKVEADQRERDRRDRERDIAPLKPAEDAIVVDSTGLSCEEVVRKMEQLVRSRLAFVQQGGP